MSEETKTLVERLEIQSGEYASAGDRLEANLLASAARTITHLKAELLAAQRKVVEADDKLYRCQQELASAKRIAAKHGVTIDPELI